LCAAFSSEYQKSGRSYQRRKKKKKKKRGKFYEKGIEGKLNHEKQSEKKSTL
jgi:hypothetical protein